LVAQLLYAFNLSSWITRLDRVIHEVVVDEMMASAFCCNMDKRYQVFVSSTYKDLIEERQQVFQTLMEMDCIPAGMEYFSAIDEDQFEFIKKVIDDCDYYLLIIGGKYGTLAEDRISYTEKEFDYAISKGKKAVVLVHKDPDKILTGKSEVDPEKRAKLESFKNKAMTGRLVDFWEDTKDLKYKALQSITTTRKLFPAVGWVRASLAISEERAYQKVFSEKLSWRSLFKICLPFLLNFPTKGNFEYELLQELYPYEGPYSKIYGGPYIKNLDVILAQFQAYGLIVVEYITDRDGHTATKIKLTAKGNKEAIKNLVVK